MSSVPVRDLPRPDPWSDPRLRAPTAEVWAAMSEPERKREEKRILGVLDELREAMTDTSQDQLDEDERERDEAVRRRNEAVRRRDEAVRELDDAVSKRNDLAGQLESARTGMAELVLRLLSQRGLTLTAEQRLQVTSCQDFSRLLRWMEQASSAPTVEAALS